MEEGGDLLLSSRLHWQHGVVSHHGVRLIAGLVVLVDHPVLLGGGPPLVLSLGVRTRLPQVVPRGGAVTLILEHNPDNPHQPSHPSLGDGGDVDLPGQHTAGGDETVHSPHRSNN